MKLGFVRINNLWDFITYVRFRTINRISLYLNEYIFRRKMYWNKKSNMIDFIIYHFFKLWLRERTMWTKGKVIRMERSWIIWIIYVSAMFSILCYSCSLLLHNIIEVSDSQFVYRIDVSRVLLCNVYAPLNVWHYHVTRLLFSSSSLSFHP